MAATSLVTYVGLGLSLVSAPMLAHALGADGRGVLAGSFVAVQTLAWVSQLGLPRGIALQIEKRSEVSIWGIIITTMLGLGVGAAVFLAAPVLANDDPRITAGIRIAVFVLPFVGLSHLGDQLAMMRGWVWIHNGIRAATLVLPSLVQVILFVLGALTLPAAFLATFSGMVLATLLGCAVAILAARGRRRAPVPWGFSLRMWVSTVFDSLAGRLDQMALTMLATAPIVGVYAIAVTCANAAGGLTQALNQANFARFVHASKGGDGVSLRRASLLGAAVSIVSGAAVVVAVMWFWRPLFGPTFSDLPPVVAILVVARIFQDQWNLRIFRDVAHETPRGILPASLAGLATLVASIVFLAISGLVSGVSVACAYLLMCLVRGTVRLMVDRTRPLDRPS